MSKKRTIDTFFGGPTSITSHNTVNKKPRGADITNDGRSTVSQQQQQSLRHHKDEKNGNATEITKRYTSHPNYPFPVAELSPGLRREMSSLPASIGRVVDDRPDLDLLYFEPYVPRRDTARELFEFLRGELPFYRVEYDIKRGLTATHIRTPRWTTVFGIDDTARFDPTTRTVVDARTGQTDLGRDKIYARYPPRPIPQCLDELRVSTEAATGCKFNFCLVNYYASGADSISYHSDDERFLGPLPAIASFSLGAKRDFLMKHKPVPDSSDAARDGPASKPAAAGLKRADDESKPLKLPLASGDMILMRAKTQANWLHAIPKRIGKNDTDGGRINITFRRAMVRGGTENYYKYNVGDGPVYRWDGPSQEMKLWKQ